MLCAQQPQLNILNYVTTTPNHTTKQNPKKAYGSALQNILNYEATTPTHNTKQNPKKACASALQNILRGEGERMQGRTADRVETGLQRRLRQEPCTLGRPRRYEGGHLTLEERGKITTNANLILDQALAKSTWGNIASCYRRFAELRKAWEEAEGVLDVPTAIILWVSKKIEMDGIAHSSALAYTYAISSARKHLLEKPVESTKLDAFRRGLRRMGAEVPRVQAIPATREEAEQAMREESDPEVRLAIGLMWYGAARHSDVMSIAAREVTTQGDTSAITWRGTKNDPFGKGQTTGLTLDKGMTQLLHRAKRGNQGQLLQHASYFKVAKALKKVNKKLTPQPTAGGNTQACHKGPGVGRRVQGDATQDRGGASAVRAAGSNDTGKEDGRDLSAPMRKLLGVQRFPQQTQSTIR